MMQSHLKSGSMALNSSTQLNREDKPLKESTWVPQSLKNIRDPILKAKVAEYIEMPISTLGAPE